MACSEETHRCADSTNFFVFFPKGLIFLKTALMFCSSSPWLNLEIKPTFKCIRPAFLSILKGTLLMAALTACPIFLVNVPIQIILKIDVYPS